MAEGNDTGALTMRRLRVVALCVVGALIAVAASASATAAQGRGTQVASAPATAATAAQPTAPLSLVLAPHDKAVDVAPGEPVTVVASQGTLSEVVVVNRDGKPISGQLAADGTRWESSESLGYGRTYTTTATGMGTDGAVVTMTATFTTAKPRRQTSLSMNPLDGQTVGVGQPLAFYFDTAIADKDAAERAIGITTAPVVEGGFYWFDDKQVHWRPKDYWPAGTKITINAAIFGRHLGNGVYGRESRKAEITIGDALVATADGSTHQMTVSVNGVVVRTIPISMGKPGHETPYGTYVAMSEHTDYTMDSGTYGLPADAPGGYRTLVAVATRLSNSGIFYHSAPWSVRDQGHRNVSHGCINMSTENARWLQEVSRKGDVYVVQNSGGAALEHWDGLGVWQIPWERWRTGGKK